MVVMLVGVDYRMGESAGLKQIEEANVECRFWIAALIPVKAPSFGCVVGLPESGLTFFSILTLAAGFMRLF